MAPFRFITSAIFNESLRAIEPWRSLMYRSFEPIFSRDFLILSACDPVTTERSFNWLRTVLLFDFR